MAGVSVNCQPRAVYLLSQTDPVAEVYARDDAGWHYQKLEGDAELVFPSLEFRVVLSSLYEKLPPLE
jgi:hypothetical protein